MSVSKHKKASSAVTPEARNHLAREWLYMENNGISVAPAIAADDSLTILREVSHAYETLKTLRKRAARNAQRDGHTYQQLGDALGINRSSAFKLVHQDAA